MVKIITINNNKGVIMNLNPASSLSLSPKTHCTLKKNLEIIQLSIGNKKIEEATKELIVDLSKYFKYLEEKESKSLINSKSLSSKVTDVPSKANDIYEFIKTIFS